MNRKYLILKKQVPKAQWGLLTGLNQKDYRDKLFVKNYGADAFSNMSETDIDNIGKGLVAEKAEKNANAAGVVGAAASLVGAGADMAFNNALEKNIQTTGFGHQLIDKKDAKLMTGQSATQGLTKGVALGASLGSVIPGIGTAIGAVAGGVIGGVAGLIGGKKKAKKAIDESQKQLYADIQNKGQQDDRMLSQQLLTGKNGAKMEVGHFSVPKLGNKSLMMKTGGKLEEPGAINIVLKGAMHKENNNLGNKDKGIPVVDAEGNKEYEVEEGEIIFRKELTDKVEAYAAAYEETKNEDILEAIGQLVAAELLLNTNDNYGKFNVKVSEASQKKYEELVKKIDPVEKILSEKPEFNIKFVSDKVLLDYDDPVEKRLLLKSIKKRYNELKEMFNNL